MSSKDQIRPRDRDAILQSLRAGVVPRLGLQHIQVGRSNEVKALLKDIDRLIDGGSAIRFIIGDYGSGKTFFLNLIRAIAQEKGLVVSHADLNPDRRIHSTSGQARSLYQELMRNISTRTKRDGGGLPSIVERFISSAMKDAREQNLLVDNVIRQRLNILSEMVGGYDFADVIASYWRAHENGDELLKSNSIRWLRGEYSTKTDAKRDLGVRTIVNDSNIYDYLKIMSSFINLAGYSGFLIGLDELVNLYKLPNAQARKSNYEQILRILNDSLQGSTPGLGFLFAGTPEFLTDPRRGLYSYEALESRLSENQFAAKLEITDLSGPIIRLPNLTQEDLYILCKNLALVQQSGQESTRDLPDDLLRAFMKHCFERLGSAYFLTPRNTIKAFLDYLAILWQMPDLDWRVPLGDLVIQTETNPDLDPLPDGNESPPPTQFDGQENQDDDLREFKI